MLDYILYLFFLVVCQVTVQYLCVCLSQYSSVYLAVGPAVFNGTVLSIYSGTDNVS